MLAAMALTKTFKPAVVAVVPAELAAPVCLRVAASVAWVLVHLLSGRQRNTAVAVAVVSAWAFPAQAVQVLMVVATAEEQLLDLQDQQTPVVVAAAPAIQPPVPQPVVLVVRASSSCDTSCLLRQHPIWTAHQTLAHRSPTTSPETKLSRSQATHL
jgi:hypothetical protein